MRLSYLPSRKREANDDNLIPLINVVFLMLIFFMVAGQIQRSDVAKVQPPASLSDVRQVEEGITLIVTADGMLYLDNQSVDEAVLATALLSVFSQSANPEAFVVLVKVDADLPVDVLQTVLQQVKATGVVRVSLATQRAKEGDQ